MHLERSIFYYLEIRKRNGISPATLRDERRLFDRYLDFCKDRNLNGRERLLMETVLVYRDWLKEGSLSPERQKRHVYLLYRLVHFTIEQRRGRK